ncbi:MAG: NAD(+) diphosphatase [Actinoallomurus sp.]
MMTQRTTAAGHAPPGYAGLGLDRGGDQRADEDWVAGLVTDPRALVRPLWRDQCLVTGEPPEPLVLPVGAVDGLDPARLVFLGIDDGVPNFAIDLSGLPLEDAVGRVGADGTADIRKLFTALPAAEAAAFAYARGLLYWHRRQRHCGCCGSLAETRNAGHLRVCTNEECGTLLFPRIEPAVITLVETVTLPRRCLLARHRASTVGGYSMLAGFVEIGESLEDAVRREVQEEAGVVVHTVDYAGSQPWPFPAGLMIGFRATATDESISVDGSEILEAHWFTREELRDHAETTGRLGRPDSIDRVMLAAWLAEGEEAS